MNRLFTVSLLAFLCLPLTELRAADDPAATAAEESTVADAALPEEGNDAGDDPAADPELARLREMLQGIEQQRGLIELPGGLARLDVPDDFYYIGPEDAASVLAAWGNPPGAETLGMLFPSDLSPFEPESWGVVVTYDDSGHVSDEDARDIDYDELLADMKDANADENEQRRQAGYPELELVGWAEAPSYDAAAHKLYWAKDLRSEGSNTLNYFVRVLGREGVLELNAVAAMEQLPTVRVGMGRVIDFAEFAPGQQYADYREGSDRLAAYGLAGLVAGGVAAKTGLWAKLLLMLIAAKKAIIAGILLIGAWIGRMFFGKKGNN